MVALHEACVAIDRGDCVSAPVGGANLILRPCCTTMMSEQGVLSPDGSCKTFSSAANGYARGEAIVGVFVKPLGNAVRDRNSIRAVIRATAHNHDGKTARFSLPSSDAHEAMIRRTYEVALLTISDTGYIECHGIGTSVGDPIETKAVVRVFGEAGVTIGSTKPNFGHTEGASGILSVLKTVLALENMTIPPSIKYSPRNLNIPWESAKLALAENALFWPGGRLERVSVNSFGLGGTNAHAIIDSAASYKTPAGPRIEEEAAQLLLYSAKPKIRSRHSSKITRPSSRRTRQISRTFHTRLLVVGSICLIVRSPSPMALQWELLLRSPSLANGNPRLPWSLPARALNGLRWVATY